MDRQIDAQSEQRWTNSSRKCDNNDSYSYSAESFPSQKATPTFSYRPFSLPLVLLLTQGKHYFFTSLFKWGYLQLREVPRLQVIKLRFEYGRVIENYAFGWCGGSVGVSGSFSHSGSIGALLCLEKGLPPPRGGGQGILDLNTQPMTGSHLASVSRVLGLQGWTTILEVSLLIFWD